MALFKGVPNTMHKKKLLFYFSSFYPIDKLGQAKHLIKVSKDLNHTLQRFGIFYMLISAKFGSFRNMGNKKKKIKKEIK